MRPSALWCSAALMLPLAAPAADDPPPVSEGLWDVLIHSTEQPGDKEHVFKYQICRTHEYDKRATALARSVPGCVMNSTLGADGTFTTDGHCTVSGTVIESKGQSQSHGDAVHAEARATYTPALGGKTAEVDVSDEKLVGPCPPDMKPGDRIIDGVVRRASR